MKHGVMAATLLALALTLAGCKPLPAPPGQASTSNVCDFGCGQ